MLSLLLTAHSSMGLPAELELAVADVEAGSWGEDEGEGEESSGSQMSRR